MLKMNERNSWARPRAFNIDRACKTGKLIAGLGAVLLLSSASAAPAAISGSQACNVVFSVSNTTDLQALQLTIDYSGVASGAFVGNAVCNLPAGLSDVLNDRSAQSMVVGWANTVTFSGPAAFATCTFTTPGAAPAAGDFAVTIDDASGDNPPAAADPMPTVAVTIGTCVPVASDCGNSIVEQGEECDDGNVVLGDGCGAHCNLTGSCSGTPESGCRHGASSSLLLKDDTKNPASNAKDQGQYQLKKGDATSLEDFKNPVGAAATYSWCVYDAGQLILGKDIPAGSGWAQKGTTGFGFKGDADGVTLIGLKAGGAGKSQIKVQAKSKAGDFASPTLPLTEPVTAQFVIDDHVTPICFESTFGTATKNTASQYNAK